LHKALLGKDAVGAIAALRQFNTRDAPLNTRLAYASSETEVLGLVVSRAVHISLADYLAMRIGKSSVPSPMPLGRSMQQGKKWLTAASSPRYATGRASD
jgi:hypothetical protein